MQKLYEWTRYKKMELLCGGTRDDSENQTFHNKCDNHSPTTILCKNKYLLIISKQIKINFIIKIK